MVKLYTLEGTVELSDDGMVGRVIGVLRPSGGPTQVTALTAVEITQSLVRLTWQNNGDAASWIVRRDGGQIAIVTSPTYSDTTVAASTSYSYDVAGFANGITGTFSTALPVTTSAPATPDVPTGLNVVTVTYNSVTIGWDAMALATSYDIHRDGGFLVNFTGTTYVNTGLSASTAYSYQVLSKNSNGSSALCTAVAATTLVNAVPIWGQIPDQSGTIGAAVSLNLDPFCDDPEAQPVTFSILGTPVPGLQISSNGQLIVGTLTTAGSFTMTIRASDGVGTSDTTVAWVVTVLADLTAPSIPQNVVATANGSTVTVTWSLSTDPIVAGQATTGVRRYRIRRNNSFLAFDDGPPFAESGVPDGTYTYTVRAEDNANAPADGNISGDSVGSVVVVSTAASAPDVPINFVATGISTTRIDLSWARGPGGAPPTDYDIDFSTTSASGPWTALPVTGTATTFSHMSIPVPVQHWYRLRANNGAIPSVGYTNATGTPISGPQAADFIVAGTTTVVNCRALQDVKGVTRIVKPGDVIQINARPTSGGPKELLEFQFPQGEIGNPIRVVPAPNTQVIFQRTNAGDGFAFMIRGPEQPSTGVVPLGDRTRYGHIIFDGFTTSGSVPTSPFDGKKHGFKWLPSINNTAQDNPTYIIKSIGFISDVRLSYCELDYRGASPKVGGVSKNDQDLTRTLYPGTFRGGWTINHCLAMNTGSWYLGSNFQPAKDWLPSRDTTFAYSMFLDAGQTPILLKNYWEGTIEVHHNIVKHSGSDPGVVIQRNSISVTASIGSVHHNWCEDTGSGFVGQSGNNLFAMRFDCNDGPYIAPFQGYPGYSSFTLKVYSNILFQGLEGGINFGSSNSIKDTGPIAAYKAEVFSNTIDNFLGSGSVGAAVRFNVVANGSFCRNNIATRTNGYSGIPAADVARNIDDSNISRYTNVYSYTNYASYTNATEAQKNYKLSNAEAVYGGSLGVDIASTDFAGAYNGTVPDTSPDAANDVTRSGGGYDMGALERA